MPENHDLLIRIDERVTEIKNILQTAGIPARCAEQSGRIRVMQWALGVLAAGLLAMVAKLFIE